MADDMPMDKGDLKKLLVKSKSEPVNCAVGQAKDASLALILLDKIKQPKALSKQLETDYKDGKNFRWGTASVDSSENAKLVIFTLNKPAPGIARKLTKSLKGTGFSKARVQYDDGSPAEEHDDEGEAPPPAQAAPGQPAAAVAQPDQQAAAPAQPDDQAQQSAAPAQNDEPAQPSAASAQNDAPAQQTAAPAQDRGDQTQAPPAGDAAAQPAQDAPAQAAAPPAQPPTGPDPTELARKLAPLILRIKDLNPQAAAPLAKLANDANAHLKATDAAGAAELIEQLRAGLDAAQANGGAAAAGAAAAGQNGAAPPDEAAAKTTYTKSSLAWTATRKKVEAEVTKLTDALEAAYKDDGIADQVTAQFKQRVAPLLDTLDEQLTRILDQASSATDAQQRSKLVQDAKAQISRYEQFISGEKLFDQLQNNPFVPVAVVPTLSATLSALSKALH